MDPIIKQLKGCRSALIATHISPDGDAIGSLIAMGKALESMGARTCWYNESPIPAVYRFLPSVGRIVDHVTTWDRFETAVILDCGRLSRIGAAAREIERIPMIINIDHHVTNTQFGHLQYVDTEACASAEIVYRLIRQLEIPFDYTIATAIYTGIMADTGAFRFSNTNRAAFRICSELIGYGVDPACVAQHLYGTYSLGRIKLLNLALDSIEITGNGKISIMTLLQPMFEQTGTNSEDVAGFINYAQRIRDVKVAALIREVHGANGNKPNFHVSLRSDGDVDVATIAAEYGGGGHASAAGFNVDGHLNEVKSRIIELVSGQ